MRIAVFSDSHCNTGRLSNLLMMLEAEGPIDAIIHLGDGSRDLGWVAEETGATLPPIYQVAGNCDFMQPGTLDFVTLNGAKLMLTHGHLYGVKQKGAEALLPTALENGVNAALYGHTHVQKCETRNGILLLNPGAAQDGHCALLQINRLGAISPKLY